MARKRLALALFASVTTVASAVLTYAVKAQPSDKPVWLAQWAIDSRPDLAVGVLSLSIFGSAIEFWRWYADSRHPAKEVLRKIVEDFANSSFRNKTKKNRITLFKATRGWRVLLYGIFRLPLRKKSHKWKALWRVKWSGTYLGVYIRPASVRNHKSTTAFHVSDDPRECEGMAGLVWEEGFCMLPNLPHLDRDEVRSFASWSDVPSRHALRDYSAATNMRDLTLLCSMDHFATHFMGSVIKKSDGTIWGVLLLDSEEAQCPFPPEGGTFKERFDDCARIVGKIVA